MIFICVQVVPLPITVARSVHLQFTGGDSVLFDFNYFYEKDIQTDSVIHP